jgi:hypothetical protein
MSYERLLLAPDRDFDSGRLTRPVPRDVSATATADGLAGAAGSGRRSRVEEPRGISAFWFDRLATTHRATHLGTGGGFRRPGGRLAHGPGGEVNAKRLVTATTSCATMAMCGARGSRG